MPVSTAYRLYVLILFFSLCFLAFYGYSPIPQVIEQNGQGSELLHGANLFWPLSSCTPPLPDVGNPPDHQEYSSSFQLDFGKRLGTFCSEESTDIIGGLSYFDLEEFPNQIRRA